MKNVLVVGYPDRIEEFKSLTLENAKVQFIDQIMVDQRRAMSELGMELEDEDDFGFFDDPMGEDAFGDVDFSIIDVVFDLNMDESPENLTDYMEFPNLVVFGCAVKRSLAQLMFELDEEDIECKLFGINSLPSFINRPVAEISSFRSEDSIHASDILNKLGMDFEMVPDRIGMVTPRIIFMIINEACYVLGEGTAEVEAVDRAMKLGTNYPYGPFEWADRIGLYNIVQVLEFMRMETGHEKFAVAPLLRDYFRKHKEFYPSAD